MLSEKIRDLRRKSGLSQEELAEKLDVSRQAVSKWETGAAVPTTEKTVELADFFGVSLDYLLRDDSAAQSASPSPSAPKKHAKARRLSGVFLIAAAFLAAVLLTTLRISGAAGDVAESSAIRLDGMGIAAILTAVCAVLGTILFITSKK